MLGATWEQNFLSLSTAYDTINRLKFRGRAVVENMLQRLQNVGNFQLREFQVLLTVQVYCQSCGESYELDDLMDRGRCGLRSKRGNITALVL